MARVLLPVLLLAAACSKEAYLDPQLPGPQVEEKAQKTADDKLPAGAIARPHLDLVLREGPAWLLDKVPVEEVMSGGRFVGWRVRELPAEWAGADLHQGDVVTKVNAMPIETPNDFWAAWTTLSVASELKIDYLRGDEQKVLSMPIVGQPDPRLPASLNDHRVPAGSDEPEHRHDKRFDTITIEGDPAKDGSVDWTTKD